MSPHDHQATPTRAAPPAVQALKHWRSFGVDEWRHVKDGVYGLALGSVLPVVLFYVTFRWISFTVAVVSVLTWSALVFFWHRHSTGRADVFSATTFAFACIKAAAGLISQNPTLYLAWPSLENVAHAALYLGTALAGRSLLAQFALRLYPIPSDVQRSAAFRHAFLVASLAWSGGYLVRAALRLWMLATLPLEVYLVADTVAGWPINLGMTAFTVWYPLRTLRRAGLTAATPDAFGAAIEEVAVEEAIAGVN